MANGLNIGTLSGRIELEDNLSTAIDRINEKLDQLDKKMAGAGGRIAEGATAFALAETALNAMKFAAEFAADALAKLTVEGAGAADIEENFERLNAGAGRLGETLLGKLRDGLHNTVTDLELMKLVNKDLAAGMNLTDDQFKTLADGAFALAQATGTDVKDALDRMNDAMLTGRTRAVAMLTGKIDLEAAEKKFAISLKTTADRLTEEEKLEAARLAILEKVTQATQRLGEQTDGIDEFAAQAATAWANFQDELGKSIATSPVLMAGFIGIKDALLEAFGGSQEEAIRRISSAINEGAIVALEWAQTIVDAVGIAGMTWNSFRIILESVVSGWQAITFAIEGVILWVAKLANLLTLDIGGKAWINAVEKDMERLLDAMAAGDAKMQELKASQDEWAVSTGKVNEKIEGIRKKMIEANERLKEGAGATNNLSKANEQAASTSNLFAGAQGNAANAVRHTAEEAKKYAEAIQEMKSADQAALKGITATKQILAGVADEVEKNVKKYLEAGIALDKLTLAYKLTDKQAQAIQETWKEEKQKLDEINQAWKELNGISRGVGQSLSGVSSVVQDQVKRFLEAGASADTLKKAYGLTDAQIKALQATLKASNEAWALEKKNIDETAGKVRTLAGEWITTAEAKQRAAQGGSFQINRGNLAQNLKTWGIPEVLGFQLAEKGFSFQEILESWRTKTFDKWKPSGPRIPGFREGGWGDFGDGTLAMLHGKEAIVPLDGPNGSMGNITNIFYVNGTAEEVAKKISDRIVRTLKQGRQFGSA